MPLRLAGGIVLLFIGCATAFGQTATVTRDVNLRPDPSSSNTPLALLAPPTTLTLLDPTKTSGYYHVKTADNKEGWVWAKDVQITTETPATPSTVTVADALAADWDKSSPQSGSFDDEEGTCGPTGDGGDTETNVRKNRTDLPTDYHLVAFKALTPPALSFPNAATHRTNPHGWTAAELAEIAPFEGEAVTVEGYIFVIRPQTGGSGESTNCHQKRPLDVDWHIALTENFGDLEPTAVVVETTPRMRINHPRWTTAALAAYVGKNTPVRISGFTMLDPEHKSHLGVHRVTLWEIHPITKIEVFASGAWLDLDTEAPTPGGATRHINAERRPVTAPSPNIAIPLNCPGGLSK